MATLFALPALVHLHMLSVFVSQQVEVDELMCAIQGRVHLHSYVNSNDAGSTDSAEDFYRNQPHDRNKTVKHEGWRQATGVSYNGKGDMAVFLGALMTDTGFVVMAIVVFGILRKVYPQIYANNVRTEEEGGFESAPVTPSDSFFGWVFAAYEVDDDDIESAVGLDLTMLLQFAKFAMKLLLALGIPMCLVLCPLHLFCGHESFDQGDRLSVIGINNISDGSWVYRVHGLFVWYVVLVSEDMIFREMRHFLPRRFRWLEDLTPPRSTTVLVEGIPENQRSDEALKEYFNTIFPDAVEAATVVKNTQKLQMLVQQLDNTKMVLEQHEHLQANATRVSWMQWLGIEGKELVQINRLQEAVAREAKLVHEEQQRLLKCANEPRLPSLEPNGNKVLKQTERALAINTASGFVTFSSEREALLCLELKCSPDMSEFVASIPPDPGDIIYADLKLVSSSQGLLAAIGYALIIGIFLSYIPFILAISTFTNFNRLKARFAFFAWLDANYHKGALMVEGVLATLALQIFMSFLPCFLMFIFRHFFCLRARAWAQSVLQQVYFWFMTVFIVFVTAVGGEPLHRLMTVLDHPTIILKIVADALPTATHFYLAFTMTQWMIHGMNLTRYMQLIKYLFWRMVVSEERAVELCEPEDQDYYGVGSRSARWSNVLMIAIIFSGLSPVITLLAFVNFVICRSVYGYLIIFAETKKHDQGGVYFVAQLWHLQWTLMLYVLVMLGILWHKAQSNSIFFFVCTAFFYLVYCIWRFHKGARWEFLPFADACTEEALQQSLEEMQKYRNSQSRADHPPYMQPELKGAPTCETPRAARRVHFSPDISPTDSISARVKMGASTSTSTAAFLNRNDSRWNPGFAQKSQSWLGRLFFSLG
jgi:hypothetical protein